MPNKTKIKLHGQNKDENSLFSNTHNFINLHRLSFSYQRVCLNFTLDFLNWCNSTRFDQIRISAIISIFRQFLEKWKLRKSWQSVFSLLWSLWSNSATSSSIDISSVNAKRPSPVSGTKITLWSNVQPVLLGTIFQRGTVGSGDICMFNVCSWQRFLCLLC